MKDKLRKKLKDLDRRITYLDARIGHETRFGRPASQLKSRRRIADAQRKQVRNLIKERGKS